MDGKETGLRAVDHRKAPFTLATYKTIPCPHVINKLPTEARLSHNPPSQVTPAHNNHSPTQHASEHPNWGETARKLTHYELGCQRVIEVGGPQTIKQPFNCIARGGEIDVIGFLTGQGHAEDGPTYLQPLLQACMVRGIEVGNRIQFEEMNRAIEGDGIEPLVDQRVFLLSELKEVYRYVWDQRHFGKIVLSDDVE